MLRLLAGDPWEWFIEYNRRRTTGLKVEDLTTRVAVTQVNGAEITEINMDIDIDKIKNRRVIRRRMKIQKLLEQHL